MSTSGVSLSSQPNPRLLCSNEVMRRLGYRDRHSFWGLVYREAIPHVRLNRRVIKFPSDALEHWLQKRRSDS